MGRKCLLLAGRPRDRTAFPPPWLWAPGLYLQTHRMAVHAPTSPPASPPSRPRSPERTLFQTLLRGASSHTIWGLPVGATGTLQVNEWVPLELNAEARLRPDRPPLSSAHIKATVPAVPTPCFCIPLRCGQILLVLHVCPRPSLPRLQPTACLPAISSRVCRFPLSLGPAGVRLASGWTGMCLMPTGGHPEVRSPRSQGG